MKSTDNLTNFPTPFKGNVWNQIPNICFCKDKDSVFRSINTAGLQSIGFNQLEEIIGYSDGDLPPFHPQADRYRKQDLYSFAGNNQLNIENIVNRNGKKVLHFIQKSPWLDEFNQIIGIIGFGFTLSRENFKSVLINLSALNLGFDFFQFSDTKKSFIYDSFYFSIREAEVVSLLLKGYSVKSISNLLQLSPRTIENYLKTIYFKIKIDKKDDLIGRAFETGFIELLFVNLVK